MADDVLNLAGRFHSTADDNKALDAIEVFDSTRDDKRQKHFNDDIVRLDEQINNTDGLKDRLEAVEDMASIQVDGGDVQIASTITPSTEGGKIPTVDAVKGHATAKSTFTTGEKVDNVGIDSEPTTGSNHLVKSSGVYNQISRLDKKLIKLVGINPTGAGVTKVGDVFYHTQRKELRICTFWAGQLTGSTFETVPFYDGAIYTYENELYIWDGTELYNVSREYVDESLNSALIQTNPIFENGSISSGSEVDNTKRLRSNYIPVNKIISIKPSDNYLVTGAIYDKNYMYVGTINAGAFLSEIKDLTIDGYLRLIIRNTSNTDISPSEDLGLVCLYTGISYNPSDVKFRLIKLKGITSSTQFGNGEYIYNDNLKQLRFKNGATTMTIPFYDGAIYTYEGNLYVWDGSDLKKISGVPDGGTEGQVLTPNGWSSDYPTFDDVEETFGDFATKDYVQQELNDYVQAGDNISNIANGAVTIDSLSQAVKDAILAGGTESIINAPDDVDIENNSTNRLQLKGGGVVRFRVKDTPANNYSELVRCMATGLPIQIENIVDLANSDGSIRDITFSGETLVFVGIGQIKNCHITGNVYIQANRTKIFHNVYFHHWTINGTSQVNGSSIYGMVLVNTNYDIYNRNTKILSAADTSVPVNPFICSLTRSKIGSFISPVLQNGKYVYKEGDAVVLTFEDDGSGNIKLPIRKDYLFLDNGTVTESTYDIKTKTASYTYVPASDLKISRLFAPTRVMDGKINGSVYPEWWGAKVDSSYDSNDAFQNAFLHGGDIQLSGDYFVVGGIRVYGNVKISGNKNTINLLANSTSDNMFEVETISGTQDGIVIYDLTLDGNKSNNNGIQDGIFCDYSIGKVPFSGYSMNNTYWYNMVIQNFTGSGVCVAVPGTSHIYSSWLAENTVDGITWNNEHFTLTNVTCWHNGRYGAYASGNHWRIIGGAYAHNGIDNIYCDGANQAQIIGCSAIDSGKFVAQSGGNYIVDPTATYGYSWIGGGNGTHELIGGNGIHFVNGCYRIFIIGARINNQNANGVRVEGSIDIFISDSQFNSNNETRNPSFKDINSGWEYVFITSCYYGGKFISTNQDVPVVVSSSTDWNDLLHTFSKLREGTNYIADYNNARNRPSDAGTYFSGTITCKLGASNTLYRTHIRMMDENANVYLRYMNINITTGAYTNDSGWKKLVPANS